MEEGTEAKAARMEYSSAAAFVEGGAQDACSICLEAFSDSGPLRGTPSCCPAAMLKEIGLWIWVVRPL
jgi:hypothetical protein